MNDPPVAFRPIGMPSALLCLSVFVGTAHGGSGRPLPGGVTVQRDPQRGTIRWLEGGDLSVDLAREPAFAALQAAHRPADVAIAFLEAYRGAFRIDDPAAEMQVAHVLTDDLGLTRVRLRQQYRNIPVQGGELLVQLDRDAHVTLVSGRYLATPRGLSTKPAIDPAAAARAAGAGADAPPPELVVHTGESGTPRLAYRVLVAPRVDEGFEVFVDATTGNVLDRVPTVYPAGPSPGARTP